MSSTKTTITSGVGQYPRNQVVALTGEEVLTFIESHCSHPELFQDIKLLFQGIPINDGRYVVKPDELMHTLTLNPVHKTLRISMLRKYFAYTPMREVHLVVNDDGLITDIRDEPFANPTNYYPVGVRKQT